MGAATPAAKPVRRYDTGGLNLEIAPTGGRCWRHTYRFDGKRKLLSGGVQIQ